MRSVSRLIQLVFAEENANHSIAIIFNKKESQSLNEGPDCVVGTSVGVLAVLRF